VGSAIRETVTLLIDGEIYAYRIASVCEYPLDWNDGDEVQMFADKEEGIDALDAKISSIKNLLQADDVIIALSESGNFRKDLNPDYKEQRKTVKKPVILKDLCEYMREAYHVCSHPKLEADDVLGILQTANKIKGTTIIVSADKDLRTIPGLHFNPDKDKEVVRVLPDVADYNFYFQTLIGDSTDNYKGCPGIGVKKATTILNPLMKGSSSSKRWEAVLQTFLDKGLDEENAIMNARMAYILQGHNYNFKTKEFTLWNPPKIQ
jgi:DNA polymerase-1